MQYIRYMSPQLLAVDLVSINKPSPLNLCALPTFTAVSPTQYRFFSNASLSMTLYFHLCPSASRCVDHACTPPMGNLASGRTLTTLSGCCGNSSHHPSCPTPHQSCPVDPHPPAHMADDPFRYQDTWWASGVGTGQEEEIRLDLETHFCLTHVVLLFRSPRPTTMMMERSQDFGRTWETLKLFAQNCSLSFGLPDDSSEPGSLCTSRYSGTTPCTRGEVRGRGAILHSSHTHNIFSVFSTLNLYFSQVIFRTLGPGSGVVDPYSPEVLAQLTLTNLRIRLLKVQTCPSSPSSSSPLLPSQTPQPSSEPSTSAAFAIYSLLARGTCLCHGHAEHCLPHNSSQEALQDSNMVRRTTLAGVFVRLYMYVCL